MGTGRPRWKFQCIITVIQLAFIFCCRGEAFVFHFLTGRRIAPSSTQHHRSALYSENVEKASAKITSGSTERSVCVIADYNDGSIADFRGDVNFSETAADLACELDVPICSHLSSDSSRYTHGLVLVPYCFGNVMNFAFAIQDLANHDSKRSRRRRPSKKAPKSSANPFFVDFMPPSNSRLGKRFEGQTGTDLLIKAVSSGKKGKNVYDLTAGFGQDSLLMAQGGASHVCMVERDPVVATLLSDALRRLNLIASSGDATDPQIQRALDLSERLTLKAGDAIHVAESVLTDPSAQRPDVCYVDPMFPTRRKAAAVKKNMQILHGLLGSQSNDDLQNENARRQENELLEAALSLARERVVVKRPITSDSLGGSSQQTIKPSYEIKGSTNRWDVYVK